MSTTNTWFNGLGLLLSLVRIGVQSLATEPEIEVHIYNYSSVSGRRLVGAEHEAAKIFQRIGVTTVWLGCPLTPEEAKWNRACAAPEAPTKPTLRLLSNSMADNLAVCGKTPETSYEDNVCCV